MRRERLAIGLVGLLAWLGSGTAWAQERPWGWGWQMHPMGWMWGAWGLSAILMMLVFWGLIVAGVVVGVRWLARLSDGPRPDAALDILRQRYARGEINKEEFEAKKRDLS